MKKDPLGKKFENLTMPKKYKRDPLEVLTSILSQKINKIEKLKGGPFSLYVTGKKMKNIFVSVR